MNEQLLIQYFYEGLTMMERSMIDVASGGALMDKTPAVTRHLISNMESNTQKFGIRGVGPSQMVNEIGAVDNLRLENQLTELTSLKPEFMVFVLPWNTPLTRASHCKKLSWTTQRVTGSSRTKVGSLIINSLEGSHFSQGRVKGHMRLSNSDLPRMHLKVKLVIGNRVHNTRHHLFNNNNNRECHLKETRHLWRT
ncbi:hypothetical protein CR513_42015, partial [Mucuna pruriens]